MKIIHCADLHLDSKMTTNLSKDKAKERKNEILRTFTRMVDYARDNGVSVILIAGDMFDTRNVSAMVRNTVKEKIIQNPDIDFLYLKGNHDTDNFLSKMDEIPDNLCLFNENWTTYRYGKVAISGLELGSANSLTAYNSLVLDHDDYNIVMLHGQLAEYTSKDRAEIISLDALKNKNIDYLALGHVHEQCCKQLDARGIWCYPGCLEGRGFDECNEKGFMLLDIEPDAHELSIHFVPIASRVYFELDVDVTGIGSTQEAAMRIEEEIAKTGLPSQSLVKLVLMGEVDVECELDTKFLEEQFQEYFYFEKVCDKTRLMVNYSDYEKDASLKGEFVRMVSASNLSEEDKSRVIRMGILALAGEEI